jgi:hypothetical protein
MNIAGTPHSALLTRFSPNRLRVYIPVAPHCCTSLSYSTRSAIVILIRACPAMASNPGPSSAAAAAPDNSSRPGLEASSAPPKKKKTHRGGKKRRNRRQSFAAGADLAQGDSMDERPSLANVARKQRLLPHPQQPQQHKPRERSALRSQRATDYPNAQTECTCNVHVPAEGKSVQRQRTPTPPSIQLIWPLPAVAYP